MRNSEQRRQFFKSFEAKSLRSRSILTQIADDLTEVCGSTAFLLLHVFLFTFWILINTGFIPAIVPFDPFPFGLLTMVVSLEAIFLSIFVLVSQNRSSYINSLREEVHMRVNLIAEEEITKILFVLSDMRKHMGIKTEDSELDEMLKRIDTNYLEKSVLAQIDRAKSPIFSELVKDLPQTLSKPVGAVMQKPLEMVQNITSSDNSSKK